MFEKDSQVIYKRQIAVVTGFDGDKIIVQFQSTPATQSRKKAIFSEQKVREKDIVLLSKTPCTNLETSLSNEGKTFSNSISEAYELLQSDEETAFAAIDFEELCQLVQSSPSPDEYWAIFSALEKSAEFALNETAFKNGKISFSPRTESEIAELHQKKYEKEHAEENRALFIERLKKRQLLSEDAKYMNEVENVALCQMEKSKVLADAGISQTPESAHKLLLETGIWAITKNPHPTRYGLSMTSAQNCLESPPAEERVEVPGIAYAIDNEWSQDPDDAIHFDGTYVWVHIADPASSIMPDSPIDKNARNRGTTLYLPEGAVRMLAEKSLADYALGLTEKSRALSFRLLLNEDSSISECEVFKTVVNVKRLTYKSATEQKNSQELKPLFEIAEKNFQRRKHSGATTIEMPEVHISVDKETKKVSITPIERFEADSMVCEMMLLAGEGAAHFAMNRKIPFPYVSQESPQIPEKIPEGFAGQFQMLKCMRKRSVGITPAMHSGLGIAVYSQVTSPLRRYSDLIAHEQLRAYLDGRKLIEKDTMLERISQGDAASIAARKASRLSETHWKLIYLLQNPEWTGEAVCIDTRGSDSLMLIPSLAMQITLHGTKYELNQTVKVRPEKIDIPLLECVFKAV